MAELTKPQFADADPAAVLKRLIERYEDLTDKVLQPAQPEQLIINSLAYEIALVLQSIQDTGLQMLVNYSRFPTLDYLGELVGVTRLPASSAECTIEFSLDSAHTGTTIPFGTRVQSKDGKVTFQTDEVLEVPSGVYTASVKAVAQVGGESGNGYLVGEISEILDPVALVITATNTTTTSAGADEETDDALRERIKLAPDAFSTAGPIGAYKFHAKSANANIVDVAVLNTIPGQVDVYLIDVDGPPVSAEVIAQVEEVLNDEKVRPLTDTVVVQSAETELYSVEVVVTRLDGTIESDVESAVSDALYAYFDSIKVKFGSDVVPSKIASVVQAVPGVYGVQVVSPTESITVATHKVPVLDEFILTMNPVTQEG